MTPEFKYHRCAFVKRWLGYGHCCSSCHEDEDYYGMYLVEIPFGKHYFIVCCNTGRDVAEAIK